MYGRMGLARPPLFVQVLWKVQRWSEALQTLFNEQVSYCVFHTHVCMCKTCESSIRRSLKKHRRGEPFRFRWDEGNESVAFHFVRQLMLKLASMLCVGIGRIVCSLQLCLLKGGGHAQNHYVTLCIFVIPMQCR